MKSILAASGDKKVWEALKECFRAAYRVDTAGSLETCLEALRKKRHEFVFVDMDLLGPCNSVKDYAAAFTPLWDLFPTITPSAQILSKYASRLRISLYLASSTS